MLTLMVSALRRHGASDALYLDNGSTYRGQALAIGCERLASRCFTPVPTTRRPVGRWSASGARCANPASPSSASASPCTMSMYAFLAQHYHQRPYGALLGKTPAQVFSAALDRPPDFLTEDKIRKALTVKERRRVNRDATLSIDGTLYVLDRPFLCGRFITIVRCLVHGAPPTSSDGHPVPRRLTHPPDGDHSPCAAFHHPACVATARSQTCQYQGVCCRVFGGGGE